MTRDNLILELEKLGIDDVLNKVNLLDKYYELLIEWNNKFNLTSITKLEDVYLKHFYDCAAICKIINLNEEYNLCDIGSGAGFPGIVLKILFPKLNITLVDSLNKRVIFLNEVIKELGLKNIKAYHDRAEEFSKKSIEKYDLATARAVAPLNILLEYAIPMLKLNGKFIAMKSNVTEELLSIENCLNTLNCKIENKISFSLPCEESLRTLVMVSKISTTPKKYPRKFNDIKNRPL